MAEKTGKWQAAQSATFIDITDTYIVVYLISVFYVTLAVGLPLRAAK